MKKLMLTLVSTSILVVSTLNMWAQKSDRKKGNEFTIAFYNVENLFDTVLSENERDVEFTPEGKVPWTAERYDVKLDRIAEVIAAITPGSFPAVVGLCEVENRQVLEDLVKHKRLKGASYRIIHFESPDERGIDNALLYRKSQFKPIDRQAIENTFPFDPEDKTRDILYVKGVVSKSKKDTLHIFVNHWPSRYGGREISAPKRNHVAKIQRNLADSIFDINPYSNIIITGDFNDEPGDSSLLVYLDAKPPLDAEEGKYLYNLMYNDYLLGAGTIYWKDWDMFDQFIVSANVLLKTEGLKIKAPTGQIVTHEWLLFEMEDGTLRPNRTKGREYYGGYSDHLPVYISFDIIR